MSLGGLVAIFLCQLAALIVPLALGIAGLISGGTAGLMSIAAWFLVGIPISYAAVDIHAARRRREAAGRVLRVGHLLRS